MTRVRAVVFDAGFTLLRLVPSFGGVFAAGCARAGLDVEATRLQALGEEAAGVWEAQLSAWDATGRTSPFAGDQDAERDFFAALYGRVLRQVGVTADVEGIVATVFEAFTDARSYALYPDAGPCLDALEASGVSLGLLSNWGPSLRDLLGHHRLLDRFDAVVISSEEGVVKPDPDIFERVLDRLGEKAGPQVAYVGDDPAADIVPARRLGLTTVLIDRKARHADHDGLRVRDLRDLPEVLDLDGVAVLRTVVGRRAAGGTLPGRVATMGRTGEEKGMEIRSTAFGNGDPIPTKYTRDEGGEDLSPALSWSDVPDEAAELLLIVEDPDAPDGPFYHWVIHSIPPRDGEVEDGQAPEGEEGTNDFDEVGYGGPYPPEGHGTHRYYFRLYAAGEPLSLSGSVDAQEAMRAVSGRELALAEWMGTYER
ncbi:MAG: YbhB/YbcL family Raf kinase inhibitor-like protein [Actinomycetota bacterium]|nr:YbhB/YbcL family Raf kinase inhibitor-like protein [Actinomycetota bacterium]